MFFYEIMYEGTQRFIFFIFIKMFILKFQARNAEKVLQANLQSPTRREISRNQMGMRLSFHIFVNRD